MRSPGVASPINAPRIAIDPRAPIDQREVETSRRVPLGWESAPAPRSRTPWLVGGGMLGGAGVVLAVALTRGAPDAPVEASDPGENRVVMTPVDPAPAPSPAADPTPTATAEPPPSAPGTNAAGSDDPGVVIEPASEPGAMHRATEPIAVPGSIDGAPASKRTATRDGRDATQRGRSVAKTGEVRMGNVRTGNARAADARTASTADAKARSATDEAVGAARAGDARTGDAKTGDANATRPAAKPQKVTGLTANEISELYASVGRELSALPGPSAQDLWSRLLLIKIQELMAAPQAKRDEAARQLQLIHQEALLRRP
jgi:hypothetical protein